MSGAILPVIECQGDPRAMGRAQGDACRDAIREELERAHIARRGRRPASLLPFLAGPVLGRGMGREIVRHYPHQGERMQGIASGAGRSMDSVMDLFVRAAHGTSADPSPVEEAPAAARGGADALLVRSLGAGPVEPGWIVRRSRPEVGFASIELTLPWLATSIAGVNEAGVAVALAPWTPPSRPPRTSAPSALLLVQECLQRFDDATGCLDWCSKRPSSGYASILVADARGGVAAISIDGEERRVEDPRDGGLVCGGSRASHPELLQALQAPTPEGVVAGLESALALVPSDRSLRVGEQPDGIHLTLHVD